MTTTLRWTAAGLAGLLLAAAGCRSPMDMTLEEEMRQRMILAHRAYLQSVATAPTLQVKRQETDLWARLDPDQKARIAKRVEEISGPTSYAHELARLGEDLLGQDLEALQLERAQKQQQIKAVGESAAAAAGRDPSAAERQSIADLEKQVAELTARIDKLLPTRVGMTLQQVVRAAAENNLLVQQARLSPAIGQARITQAEAVFDALYFADLAHNVTDTPRPIGLFSPAGGAQAQASTLATGIRKPLTTGGLVTVQTDLRRRYENPSQSGLGGGTISYYEADILLRLEQPLLRNFGSEVNRAEIVLTESARAQSVEDLRRALLETAGAAEAAYWRLTLARQELMIRQRLLDKTLEESKRLEARAVFDATAVEVTEARSIAALRQSDLIRARAAVRAASDALKQLVNSPGLNLADETVIVPLDSPADVAVKINLLDAVGASLRHRPEVTKALHQINDASVRQRVADNLRLPELNASATLRFNGLDTDEPWGAWGPIGDSDFIDYLLGLSFEVPIGNRGPEALHTQRVLERTAAVINYQTQAQEVVRQVKDAMRSLQTAYELIGTARTARKAAGDSLRAILEQEAAGEPLKSIFILDRKIPTLQRVAEAEVQETQAVAEYNTALAQFYQVMGTLLEQNGIELRSQPQDAR